MDLSLIRPCLSDFELPVVLVDLILHYVQRMLEERYYTWKDLNHMPKGISYTFILNMKIVTVDTLSRRRTCNEGECGVDVIHNIANTDVKFILNGVDHNLVRGIILYDNGLPYIKFWVGYSHTTIVHYTTQIRIVKIEFF